MSRPVSKRWDDPTTRIRWVCEKHGEYPSAYDELLAAKP